MKTSESKLETHQVMIDELKAKLGINGMLMEIDLITNPAQQVVGLQYVIKVEDGGKENV